jgi:phosphatidate phosphatase APP1
LSTSDKKKKMILLPNNKHRIRLPGSVKIIPFISYGNKEGSFISGLIVEENGISKPVEGQSRWQNFKTMVKRYMRNEIEYIGVKVEYLGMKKEVTTDRYGIFRCYFQHDTKKAVQGNWQKFSVSLTDFAGSSSEGEVMIVADSREFGIISDIDDTIILSYAANKLMKLRLMLLNNAHTRMPFKGISAFYHALQKGKNSNGFNPVFYVSNSEWNLYDLLYEFIEFNRIPKGPLLLREMAIRVLRPWKIREVNKNHKTETISRLFRMFPEMKFILIGDSGQKDPEIYWNIAKHFPGRILAIYIRDVGANEYITKMEILSNQVKGEFKTDILLVKDTEAAAKHAIEKGFISTNEYNLILAENQTGIND